MQPFCGFFKEMSAQGVRILKCLLPKPPQQQGLKHWELISSGITTALDGLALKTQGCAKPQTAKVMNITPRSKGPRIRSYFCYFPQEQEEKVEAVL